MKVRILSGNAKGFIEEVDQVPGESMISTGYAELVPDEPSVPANAHTEKEEPAKASPAPERSQEAGKPSPPQKKR